MAAAMEHSQFEKNDLLVLLAIAKHALPDGTNAWPSHTTIAELARVSERTVVRALRRLEDSGELAIYSKQGPRGCNAYELLVVDGPIALVRNNSATQMAEDSATHVAERPAVQVAADTATQVAESEVREPAFRHFESPLRHSGTPTPPFEADLSATQMAYEQGTTTLEQPLEQPAPAASLEEAEAAAGREQPTPEEQLEDHLRGAGLDPEAESVRKPSRASKASGQSLPSPRRAHLASEASLGSEAD